MNILSIKSLSIIFIMTLSLVTSCTRNIKETRIVNENAKYDFIFASDSSEFKDGIRQKLIERYSDQANINLVNIGKIKDINTKDYDVILIMDTCIGGARFNKSLNSFFTHLEDNKNIVLFMTAGNSNWKYSNKGIDAITSASKIEDEESIYLKISKQIDQIIADKNE